MMPHNSIKTLAVRQPWCTLIAEGTKTIEVRSWRTHYRGPLVIAASGAPVDVVNDAGRVERLPTGCLVCRVDLVDVRPWMRHEVADACLQDWDTGYWGWILSNPRHLRPVRHKGRLMLYDTQGDEIIDLPADWHYLDYPRSVCVRCGHPPGPEWLDGGQTCPRCRLVRPV